MRDLLRTDRYAALRKILREARLAQKLDQAEVGKSIGRPQTYISDIETGVRRLDIIEFLRLTNALGLDPLEVMTRIIEIDDVP